MTRLGLIGAGTMAMVYAQRMTDIPDGEITAVASPNTAEEFVAEHVPSATAYASAETLCAEADVDAVAILTPTHTHADLVEIAAANGLAILCEKPLARTLAQAERIQAAVEQAGITFMTAHAVRFFPEYERARELVADGEIGEPGVARTRRAFGYQGERGWFDEQDKSGGVLLDLAVHDFDWLRSVFGEVDEVYTRHAEWSVDGRSEVSLTLLRFASGVVGHVEGYWIEVPGIPFTTDFELIGDEGAIEYEIDDTRPIATFDETGLHVPRDPIGDAVPFGNDPYAAQLQHFIDCVEGGDTPRIPVEEGIASMRVSLAAIESVERGEPVAPAEVAK